MSERLPDAGGGAGEEGFKGLHVGNSVGERGRDVGVVKNRLGEQVALDGVLVADLEGDFLDTGFGLLPDAAGAVRWGVERDLDLDAAVCTEDVDALKRRQLRRAGERRGPTTKVQNAAGEPVDLKLGVVFDMAEDPVGLGLEEKPRQRDAIATDVHQAAAPDVCLVADVVGIAFVVGEKRLDRLQLADVALGDPFPGLAPLL